MNLVVLFIDLNKILVERKVIHLIHSAASPFFILASQSPRRLEILNQMGIIPDRVIASGCNESQVKKETPRQMTKRLAFEKMNSAIAFLKQETGFKSENSVRKKYILTADTSVVKGRTVLFKPENEEQAKTYLQTLSGSSHRVYTAIQLCCIWQGEKQKQASQLVESRVKFKKLSSEEIQSYLKTREWEGKSGGYAIQGRAACFIQQITGSYSAIMGLPVYETYLLLTGLGLNILTHRR